MAFRVVVAEHKKKSTCMGASVPESVGEEKKAGFVRVHYYMWETFLFFPRRTREGPSGSSQSLPGSRTGGARDCSSHVSSLKEERSLGLCYRRSSSSRRTVSWRVSILSFSE